ncbi:hypothetical protein C0991_010275 [Blastosporella zonata]|nr:hypothetical protein C0991_010275 [Blastosporella zonata]
MRLECTKKAQKKTATVSAAPTPPDTACHIPIGDMVFENACLFLRDALLSRLFADAVKAGDSSLVILVLKKKVIMQSWLLNPTGKANRFVEIDLVQEHLNFWIKKIYKADSDAHSWDWLALISPAVDVLRQLATKIHGELGLRQGLRHTVLDLEKDMDILMKSLDEHEVYVVKPSRVLDPQDSPVPDVLSVGYAVLTHGSSTNPLTDFNAQFDCLCQCRKLTPSLDLHQLADASNITYSPLSDCSPAIPVSQLLTPASHPPAPKVVDKMDDTSLDDESMPGLVLPPDEEDRLYEDLFLESPTLPHVDEEDVALEMDEFYLEDDEDEFNEGMEFDE